MKKRFLALFLTGVIAASALDPLPQVVYGAEAEAESASVTEAESGSELSALIGNLEKYMPQGSVSHTQLEGREKVTGIQPIMPAEGNVNTLMIFTEFEDCEFSDEFEKELEEKLYQDQSESSETDPCYPRESLRAYYQRASFGKLNISGDFIEYEAPHKRSWYNNADQSNDILYQEALDHWKDQIIKKWKESGEAESSGLTDLQYLNSYLKKYDQDGDLRIDGCYLACAGGNTGWGTQWWAYRVDTTATIGSYQLSNVVQVVDTQSDKPGNDNIEDYLETFIHETGHYLGLDDYYSYGNAGVEKIRTFAMMNNNHGDQDGFAKMLLGWLPTESVHYVDENETVSLRPFAETGDVAIILPKEEKDQYGIYSQFILAEHFKYTLNDRIKYEYLNNEKGKKFKAAPQEGLRFYHVYARLDEKGTSFVASNCEDEKIPLISGYVNTANGDPYGFYRNGDSLTPTTVPDTYFYEDPYGTGYDEYCNLVDSGISIDSNADPSGDTISFSVNFSEEKADNGPQIRSAELLRDESKGFYVKTVFDRDVTLGTENMAVIYDASEDKKTGYDAYDAWGMAEISKKPLGTDTPSSDTLYFLLDDSFVRPARGVMVLQKGFVSDINGTPCGLLHASVDGRVSENTLQVSVPSGTYQKAFTVGITGAVEGAEIYCTTDGTEPVAYQGGSYVPVGQKYSGPYNISSNTVLKAIAMKDGVPVSDRLKAAYVFEEIRLERDNITLDVDESFQLKAAIYSNGEETVDNDPENGLSYKSSDPSVVAVGEYNDILVGISEGTAVITVSTLSGLSEAQCSVTVKKGVAEPVYSALRKTYGIDAGSKQNELSVKLGGSMTFSELAASGNLSKLWIAEPEKQTYCGKECTPEPLVLDGVKFLEKDKDYTLSYSNNIEAGTAKLTAKFTGSYAGSPSVEKEFTINKAVLGSDAIVLPMGLKPGKKTKLPVPKLILVKSGVVVEADNTLFSVSYYDASGNTVDSLKKKGFYTLNIEPAAQNPNYIGHSSAGVTVMKKNLVEGLKVKKVHKTLTADANGTIPVFGKDYKIKLPSGYTKPKKGKIVDTLLEVKCYNNTSAGTMVMVLTPKEGSYVYAGSQIVTFELK